MAWHQGWPTQTLVWNLWLASLTMGYLTLALGMGPLFQASLRHFQGNAGSRGIQAADPVVFSAPVAKVFALLYTVFFVAFFTVHFGGFHWGHSLVLNHYLPNCPVGEACQSPLLPLQSYREAIAQGWWFLPLCAVVEVRRLRAQRAATEPGDMNATMALLTKPYGNVVRMHLLIFYFFAVLTAGLPAPLIYTTVYAVYFFPWQLLRRHRPAE